MTFSVTEKATKMNAWQMPKPWKYLREDLVLDNGLLLDQVLKRNGILPRIAHKEPGTTLQNKCCWTLQRVVILLSVQRLHCPQTFLQSKGRGKLSIHFAADGDTIDTIFRSFLSVNQLSVYGAVAAVCEEFESHQDRSGELDIVLGQSIVLGEVKAEAPLQNQNPMNDQIIWQQYIQEVESLSPENKVSKFFKEAGFMCVVEVGQHFVTKHTGSLTQFRSVSCREYTLPDSRKHENWACIRSHDQFSALQIWIWNSNLVCESRQFSILGQNILWNDQICGRFYSRQHRNSCRSTRRASATNKHQGGCSQIKGKSKATTESTRWYYSNHTNTWKKMDWHRAIRTKSCLVRSLEESD